MLAPMPTIRSFHSLMRPSLTLFFVASLMGSSWTQDDPNPRLEATAFPSAPGEVLREIVLENPGHPVAMAFLPDGTLLFTDKESQQVRVIEPGGVEADEPFLDLSGEEPSARGMIGLAIDPDFTRNGFVYLSLSSNLEAPVERDDIARIIRVVAQGRRADLESLITLVTVPGEALVGYEGGNLHFAPNGQLYFVIGDRRPDNAPQDPQHCAGHMLRYERDGTIPEDNPFGPENPSYALGLRNSFDFTFDPLSGGLFATENGPAADDEINLVEAGLNYGWPAVSGPADLDKEQPFTEREDYRGPLIETGPAPTGIVVDVEGTFGIPGALLVVEWSYARLLQLELSDDRRTIKRALILSHDVGTGINDLAWGPDGALYSCSPTAIERLTFRGAGSAEEG